MFLIIRMRPADKLPHDTSIISSDMVFQSFKVTTESLKLWVLSGSMKIEHVRISLIRNAIFVKIRVLLKVFSVANSEVISLHKAKTSGLPLFREIGYLATSISR